MKYLVRREAYRGPAGQLSNQRPDVIVVQITSPGGQPQPGANIRRDILWIECKAPCHYQPNGWNSVMSEAVGRLRSAHPTRDLFVILAVGLEWMPFYWNPFNQQAPLQILKDNERDHWPVDQGICVANVPNHNNLQRHIVNDPRVAGGPRNTIDTTRAFSLDYWTMDGRQPPQPINLTSLQLLEAFFAVVRAHAYLGGPNPAHFP